MEEEQLRIILSRNELYKNKRKGLKCFISATSGDTIVLFVLLYNLYKINDPIISQ